MTVTLTPSTQTAPTERRRSLVPHRRLTRPAPLLELAILGLGYTAYELTRVAVAGSTRSAMIDGRRIYRLEQLLHLSPERWLNGVLSVRPGLAHIAGYYYTTLHFVVTIAVLAWLYWRHPGNYRTMRTALVAATLPSLLAFWLFPAAPPRFAIPHLSDTLDDLHIPGVLAPRASAGMANLYAAMPSLHVAWAAWCALSIWAVFRREHRYLALLPWTYPIATALVVISTANHYFLDAPAGLLALALGVWVAVHREHLVGLSYRAGRWLGQPMVQVGKAMAGER